MIFLFFKYLIISQILAVLFISKAMSRPLISIPSEFYFIYLKWRNCIFNIFLIFQSSKVSPQPLYRILFSNSYLFCFFIRFTRLKKNLGPYPILGLFGPFFRLAIFKTFYLSTRWTLYDQSYLIYTSLNYLWKFSHI